jgi:hypothetical protein
MTEPKPAQNQPDEAALEAEIDEVPREFGGDARAAIRALLDDQATLIEDAQQAVSRGFLPGKFSEGARRPQVDDEP